MKQVSNKDMLNAIRNEASAEYQERVPEVAMDADVFAVQRALQDFPSAKNEFIATLTNKVVRSEFFSRVYNNPLKELKKGMLPYGSSVEQLFVEMAKVKGFLNDTSGQEAGALLSKKPADVKAMYIERNFQYVYEVSISDQLLKTAFMTATGLSEMVNQLVGSLMSGAEYQEYKDMIANVIAAADGKQLTAKAGDGTMEATTIPSNKGVTKVMPTFAVGDASTEVGIKKFTKTVRALAGRMKFPTDKYNMAGVTTFCQPEDLVLLTTPEMVAELDVEVLASAFNVSSAEVQTRIIIVDQLPKRFATALGTSGASDVDCYGILMDKRFVQSIDTVNESRQFENGRALMTNVFLHRQGIMATCYFVNAIALIKA